MQLLCRYRAAVYRGVYDEKAGSSSVVGLCTLNQVDP
jgi:hypothetical protein